jgi:type IV secretion system protein VirB4
MRFLDEFRRRPASLADHLLWALLVAPGVVLNKDGSFQATCAFRGPDLESAIPEELMATRARLNNALKRLGSGWCLHVEARRRAADPVPPSIFPDPISWLIDEERRALLAAEGASFETDYFATFTWAPPIDRTTKLERMMLSASANDDSAEGRRQLQRFQREVRALVDVLASALPEARLLSDEETLDYLHATVSTRRHAVRPCVAFLDAVLADEPLTGGVAPQLGDQHVRIVSVRSFPSRTTPGLLDALSALPFPCRFVCRWIALDKADAEKELTRLRKQWWAKRKGIGTLARESITKEESPLVDAMAPWKR